MSTAVMGCVRSARWALVSLGMALLAPTGVRAEASEVVNAGWQSHELTMHYSSFETWYNCDSFENKLEQILRQLGARDDVKVRTSGCYGNDQVGNMLTSRITVAMPLAGDSSGESFTAGYRTVTLRADQGSTAGLGDCELLEQVQRQLLPKLKLQRSGAEVRCTPGNGMNARQSLDVRALVPTVKKTP